MTHTSLLLIWHTPPTRDEEFEDYEEYEDCYHFEEYEEYEEDEDYEEYEDYHYFEQYEEDEGYKDCGNYEYCKNLKTIVKIVSLWITMMLAQTWKCYLTSAAAYDDFEE